MHKTLVFALVAGVAMAAVIPQAEDTKIPEFKLLCGVCTDLVNDIIQSGAVDKGEAAVEAEVNKECDKLLKPGSFTDSLCKSLIDGEITNLITALKNNPNDAAAACKFIKMC